jgi:alpha,alpha-trehalose phosphorylase
MAAEVGDVEKALEYARVATLMDLGDVAGNVKDGCHIAAMGGVWMIFAYGFAGLRDYSGELSFRPALPDVFDCLQFKLRFQGRSLEIDVSQDETRYTLTVGSELTIRHEEHEVCLSSAAPSVVLPNSKPSERADMTHAVG